LAREEEGQRRSIGAGVAFCSKKDTHVPLLKSTGVRQSVTLHITTARKPL
jgi:hypothetical protein